MDTVAHPSLEVSDDEEPPPVLTPQKKTPDINGNMLRDMNPQEQDPLRAPNMDSEIKELLNGVARRLMPDAIGQVSSKPTPRSKSLEFSAKLMGLPAPDTSGHFKTWNEHPIIQMSREEVNNRFADMPFGPESEKRLGIPTPAQAAKVQTTAAAPTLSGAEMTKLPHQLRTEIPNGAKIETVELKSKIPRAVEEESSTMMWNSVRNFNNKILKPVLFLVSSLKLFCSERRHKIHLTHKTVFALVLKMHTMWACHS